MSVRHSTQTACYPSHPVICLLYQPQLCPLCDTHFCVHCLCIRYLMEGQHGIILKASLLGSVCFSKRQVFSAGGRAMQPLHTGCLLPLLHPVLLSYISNLRFTSPVLPPLILYNFPFPSDTHKPPKAIPLPSNVTG